MTGQGDSCPTCGMWTQQGRDEMARRAREHPIYGTDFSRPLSALVGDARSRIAEIRGALGDISAAYPGWGDRIKDVEGLLTCGLVSLHLVREEMLKVEARASGFERAAAHGRG